MLRSSMREGHTGVGHSPAREVRVEESAAAVRAFVGLRLLSDLPNTRNTAITRLLYTGGLPTGEGGEPAPSAETLLGVFGLCHRWQLAPLAELLEERLATMIMPENLEIMLEVSTCALKKKKTVGKSWEPKTRHEETCPIHVQSGEMLQEAT